MNLPDLETQTAEQFAGLKNDMYRFACRFPDGKVRSIRLHVWKARAKIRFAQFDIFHTDWAFEPCHSSTITVRSPRENFGVELRRAADSLYARLVPFDPSVFESS